QPGSLCGEWWNFNKAKQLLRSGTPIAERQRALPRLHFLTPSDSSKPAPDASLVSTQNVSHCGTFSKRWERCQECIIPSAGELCLRVKRGKGGRGKGVRPEWHCP